MEAVTETLGLLLGDNALARAFGSAVIAFLFVQAVKVWPLVQTADDPDWRPRAVAIASAVAINLASEWVQVEQAGVAPLWARAALLGFAGGVVIVVAYPAVKPWLAKFSGNA